MNYAMVESHVVFRTAPGMKLDAAGRAGAVAFEIDHIDDESQTGWSVVVRGHAEIITNERQLLHLDATGLEPYVAGKNNWVMIHPDTVTGRRVPAGSFFRL